MILDAIQGWGKLAPQQKAHVSGDQSLTYGELVRLSDVLAAYFARTFGSSEAAEAQRPIAIYGHKEPELLIGFLAAVKSGHPYVPIDVAIPSQRIEQILASSRALVLLTAPEIAQLTVNVA